jgi:hypothetical protein
MGSPSRSGGVLYLLAEACSILDIQGGTSLHLRKIVFSTKKNIFLMSFRFFSSEHYLNYTLFLHSGSEAVGQRGQWVSEAVRH